jgi:hypothetical protein
MTLKRSNVMLNFLKNLFTPATPKPTPTPFAAFKTGRFLDMGYWEFRVGTRPAEVPERADLLRNGGPNFKAVVRDATSKGRGVEEYLVVSGYDKSDIELEIILDRLQLAVKELDPRKSVSQNVQQIEKALENMMRP